MTREGRQHSGAGAPFGRSGVLPAAGRMAEERPPSGQSEAHPRYANWSFKLASETHAPARPEFSRFVAATSVGRRRAAEADQGESLADSTTKARRGWNPVRSWRGPRNCGSPAETRSGNPGHRWTRGADSIAGRALLLAGAAFSLPLGAWQRNVLLRGQSEAHPRYANWRFKFPVGARLLVRRRPSSLFRPGRQSGLPGARPSARRAPAPVPPPGRERRSTPVPPCAIRSGAGGVGRQFVPRRRELPTTGSR